MNVLPSGRPGGEYSIAEEGREAQRVLWSTTVWTKGACGKGRRRVASLWGLTRRPVDLEPLAALPCRPGRADETDARSTGQAEETPPRVWGRPSRHSRLQLAERNTPTYVGKTAELHVYLSPRQKHPHMRGEDATLPSAKPPERETPPHAWGRRNATQRAARYNGNTPTCVGKTATITDDLREVWKHPHMRGEDLMRWCHESPYRETPPHAWGRLYVASIRYH